MPRSDRGWPLALAVLLVTLGAVAAIADLYDVRQVVHVHACRFGVCGWRMWTVVNVCAPCTVLAVGDGEIAGASGACVSVGCTG